MLTTGNIDDRKPLKKVKRFKKNSRKSCPETKDISGKNYSKNCFPWCAFSNQTKKKYESSSITSIMDTFLLRNRAVCETIIDQLKNICQVVHPRHISPQNFLTNKYSALVLITSRIRNYLSKSISQIPNNYICLISYIELTLV